MYRSGKQGWLTARIRVSEKCINHLIYYNMSVPVTVVARKNPAKQNEPEKFYAMAQAAGEMNFRSLCKDASEGCTVMRSDIAAVLYALIDSMMKSLAKGEIVRFGDFGSFQVGVSSTGVEKKDDFSANQVKGAHIIFRPGIDLTEMIKTLTFKKKTVGKVVAENELPGGNTGGNTGGTVPVNPGEEDDPNG